MNWLGGGQGTVGELPHQSAIALGLFESTIRQSLAVVVLDVHVQRGHQAAYRAGEIDHRAVIMVSQVAYRRSDEVSTDLGILAVQRLGMAIPLDDDPGWLAVGARRTELQGDQFVVLDVRFSPVVK